MTCAMSSAVTGVSLRNTKSSSKRASGGRPRSSTTSMTSSRFGKTDERLADREGEDIQELRELPVRHEGLGVNGQPVSSSTSVDCRSSPPPSPEIRDGSTPSRPPARLPGTSSFRIPRAPFRFVAPFAKVRRCAADNGTPRRARDGGRRAVVARHGDALSRRLSRRQQRPSSVGAVTEDEIIAFAKRYDPQPFHTDPEVAKRGRTAA